MARKSRRFDQDKDVLAEAPAVEKSEEALATALYARISVEQEDMDSLDTQLEYLRMTVDQRSDLKITDTYVDNGFSGTSFDRPEFTRMMADVRSGRIQCIVVKDLSRFGRNHLETGYYLEVLLPKLNVRLIAINDGFDSQDEDSRQSISIPVKNMINEMYAKDLSRKVYHSFEMKRKAGTMNIVNNLYGYTTDWENGCYLPDPESAAVVQFIFLSYLSGKNMAEIAELLNLLGIITPGDYMSDWKAGRRKPKNKYWDGVKVGNVMKREEYAGDRFVGKTERAVFRNQKETARKPREEWIRYTDDHEVLIPKSDFDEVVRRREEKEQERRSGGRNRRLTGGQKLPKIVFCKHCGRKLTYHRGRWKNGGVEPDGSELRCVGRKRYLQTESCGVGISEDFLRLLLVDQIRLLVKTASDHKALLSRLDERRDGSHPVKHLENRMARLTVMLDELDKKILKANEDITEGILDAEEFYAVCMEYKKRQEKIREEIRECGQKKLAAEKTLARFSTFADRLAKEVCGKEITEGMIATLVEKVTVDADGNVEITYMCRDIFRQVEELMTGGEEE